MEIDDLQPSQFDEFKFETAMGFSIVALHPDSCRSSNNEFAVREAIGVCVMSINDGHHIWTIMAPFAAFSFFLVAVTSVIVIRFAAEKLVNPIS